MHTLYHVFRLLYTGRCAHQRSGRSEQTFVTQHERIALCVIWGGANSLPVKAQIYSGGQRLMLQPGYSISLATLTSLSTRAFACR